eukprot:COSAG02_NODE_289_length_25587_cov_34.270323_2_plen_179_part_00
MKSCFLASHSTSLVLFPNWCSQATSSIPMFPCSHWVSLPFFASDLSAPPPTCNLGGVDLLANKSHVDTIARERALADSDRRKIDERRRFERRGSSNQIQYFYNRIPTLIFFSKFWEGASKTAKSRRPVSLCKPILIWALCFGSHPQSSRCFNRQHHAGPTTRAARRTCRAASGPAYRA